MYLVYGRIVYLDMFLISKLVLVILICDIRLCFVFGVFFVVVYFSENVYRYDKRNLVILVKLFVVVK